MDSCEGFLLVDKPIGLSSFQVVKKVRAISQVKRVGHAGTLDPFASGLLILALGRTFTRQIDHFQGLPKRYLVRCALGLSTDTLDSYGQIDQQVVSSDIRCDEAELRDCMASFLGEQEQIPPKFSAKKVDGKRLYRYARDGQDVEIKASTISISEIHLDQVVQQPYPLIDFSLRCSKGTYVRSLVRDIGVELGVPAYTKDLIRDEIGPYTLSNAVSYDSLTKESIRQSVFRYVES